MVIVYLNYVEVDKESLRYHGFWHFECNRLNDPISKIGEIPPKSVVVRMSKCPRIRKSPQKCGSR